MGSEFWNSAYRLFFMLAVVSTIAYLILLFTRDITDREKEPIPVITEKGFEGDYKVR